MLSSVGILVLIYFTTIFFGGAHVWSQSVITLSVLVMTVYISVVWLVRRINNPSTQGAVVIDPLSVTGIFFVLATLLQLAPVSPNILQCLSPNTWEIWKHAVTESKGITSFSISLYPFMTGQSIKFAFIVLIVLWFALYGIKTRRDIKFIIEGLLLLGVIEALYGMAQLLPGNHYSLFWSKTVSQDVATGTFIDRNHLAGFLSMLICIGIGYLWAIVQKPKKEIGKQKFFALSSILAMLGLRGVLCLLSVAVMMAGLLSTASRGGTVTVIIGILLMAGLLISRMVSRQAVFYPVVLLLIVSLYVGYVASDRVIERFAFFESGFEGRVAIARSTLDMAKDFPLTGIGLGAFQFVFPKYQNTQLASLIDYAHNDWAQLFAEMGIIGLGIVSIGFIWFVGLTVVQWRKRRDPLALGIGLGGMGALFAISLHSFSEFNLHMPANVLVLAVILAVTYKALFLHEDEGGVSFSYPTIKVSLLRVVAVILVLGVTAGALFAGKDTVALWRADTKARIFWNSTIHFNEPTNNQLRKAWSLVPENAAYWEWIARRVDADREGSSALIDGTPYEKADDPAFDLWKEAIRRNPGFWHTWHAMGWAAYLPKTFSEPENLLSDGAGRAGPFRSLASL